MSQSGLMLEHATSGDPAAAPPAFRRVSRRELAVYRPVWLAVGSMYVVFAVGALAAMQLVSALSTRNAQLLVGWLVLVAAIQLRSRPPAIGTLGNHAVLACAWLSVAFAFVGAQPAGGMALGGMMFIGPLIAVRLESRREIVGHVAAASTLFLLVAASGLLFDTVNTATVLAAGLSAMCTPVQAYSCTRILEAADLQGEQLELLIRQDQLTGVGNRRLFDERLSSEVDRSHRSGEPFALLVIDVTAGGGAGPEEPAGEEELLRATASALAGATPDAAVIARLGGAEFAVLLPGADPDKSRRSCDELRGVVTELGARIGAPVTPAVGVADWPGDGLDAREIISCADRRLREDRLRRDERPSDAPANEQSPAGSS